MRILCIPPNQKHDFLVSSVVEGLKQIEEVELYCTDTGNGCINIITDQQFTELLPSADYVFVLHGKRPGKYRLLEQIEDWSRVVFIDGSEWSINYYPPFNKSNFLKEEFLSKGCHYFKRECYPEYLDRGVKPLPFAAMPNDFANRTVDKDIDVLCGFGNIPGLPDVNQTSWRSIAIQACNELKAEGYSIITHKVPNYLDHVSRSWITIDAWGGGEINSRTFQIPANRSFGLCKGYEVIIPNYTPGQHYDEWNSPEELKEKIRNYLADKEKLSYLIDQAYENTMQYHTAKARVKYILTEINTL